jgi:hypothetical protein
MTTRYCVTKQIQWPDGTRVVEISSGDEDYTNPGALGGHFESHETATEAVEDAIALALKWQQESDEPVYIGRGYTMGMTMPFDPEDLDEGTFAEYRKWAEKQDEKLEHCDYCGAVIGEEKWEADDWSGTVFCSEYCATEAIRDSEDDDDDDEDEDDDDDEGF